MSARLVLSAKDDEGIKTDLYEKPGGSPEIYVDGIQGIMLKPTHSKFNFFTDKMSAMEKNNIREIACTLVIPNEQLESIGNLFLKIASQSSGQITIDDLMKELEEKPKKRKKKKA